MPEMIRVLIVKRDGGRGDSPSRLYSRQAKAYKKWESPDMKRGGVNKIWIDDFSCLIRQEVYDEYKPVRDHYARQAKLQIAKNLRHKQDREHLQELKTQRSIRRLEKQIYGKTVDQKIEEAQEVPA
jgi:hypothetical protein